MTNRFHYCPKCGVPIEYTTPPGDDRQRDTCPRCERIFYHNPLVVVGCIPEWDGRILMCRRAIEPRLGFWTLPAGFLELGETTAAAGARETREEALADVSIEALFSFLNVADIGQIHMFYRARMTEQGHAPGLESSETALMAEHDIPWRELAFPTIHRTLERYFADRRTGAFELHTEDLGKEDWRQMRLQREPSETATNKP